MLIFVIPIATAGPGDNLNNAYEIYYKMEESSSPIDDVNDNDIDATCTNCPTWQQAGIIGFSPNFVNANLDKFLIDANTKINTGTDDFSINQWVKFDDVNTKYELFGQWTNSPFILIDFRGDGSDDLRFQVYTDASNYCTYTSSASIITDTNWHMVTAVRRNGPLEIWVDGVNDSGTVGSANCAAQSIDEDRPYIGYTVTGARHLDGNIDEWSFYSAALNSSEITYLYNGGSPTSSQQPPFGVVTGPVYDLTILGPLNTTKNNTNLIALYNISEVSNCSIYINSTLNLTNLSVSANTTHNFNVSGNDGLYKWYINCTDGTSNSTSDLYHYTKDATSPAITLIYPNQTFTTHHNISENFTINAYTTDNSLYWANVTLLNSTGGVVWVNISGNITGDTRYNWTQSFNPLSEGLEWGSYTMNFESWDSHTKKKIQRITVIKDNNAKKLSFPFSDGDIEISLIGGNKLGLFESVDSEYLYDRYSFIFEFKNDLPPNSQLIFRLYSSRPLTYIKNSPYKGHFVNFKHWVDFQGVDGDLEISKVDENNYDVTLTTGKNQKKFNFESVGFLNYNLRGADVVMVNWTNITIWLNDTVTGLPLSNFSASVTWSNGIPGDWGCSGPPGANCEAAQYQNKTACLDREVCLWNDNTKHTNGTNLTYWIPIGQNVTINGSKTGYSIDNDLFPAIGQDNRYLQAVSAGLVMNFYNELTEALINNVTINIALLGNISGEYNTTTGTRTISGIASDTYEIRYTANGYYPRSYFVTLNGTLLETVNLYMCSVVDCDRVIHTVYDQDSNIAPNITIKLLRYYPASSAYTIVSMITTNFEGQAALYAALYDTYYRLQYENQLGTVLKLTDPTPFLSTETDDIVNLETPDFLGWREVDNVFYNLSWINSSGIIYARFHFIDTRNIVREGCLNVQRVTPLGVFNICDNCTQAATAILTCPIDHTQSGQFKAAAVIDTNTVASWHTVLTLWWILQKSNNPTPLGQEGLFFAAVMVTTISLMAVGSVMGSVVLMVVGLIIAAAMDLIVGFNIGILWYFVFIGFIIIFLVRKSKE